MSADVSLPKARESRRRRRGSAAGSGALARLASGGVAALALAFLAWALARYPFGPLMPAIGVAVGLAVFWRWRALWLVLVPALLPVIDLTPWTGDIFVTESDLLLATALLAGHARLALGRRAAPAHTAQARISPTAGLLLGLLMLSCVFSVARGFLPYQPLSAQPAGYNNTWNSLRVGKGFLFALLLLPLLVAALRERGEAAMNLFVAGLLASLGTVAAVCFYERLAYMGLTDFATDYRITGPFWEMNVGGAPLDAWLSMTLPFVVWAVRRARRLPALALMLALGALAVYATLATFSRAAYAACLVIAVVLAVMQWWRRPAGASVSWAAALGWVVAAGLAFGALWMVFHSGGYRALATLIGLMLATHFAVAMGPVSGARAALHAALVGAIGGAGAIALFAALDKGAYVAWSLAALAFIACAAGWWRQASPSAAGRVLGGWAVLVLCGALVARHWADAAAALDVTGVAAVLGLTIVAAQFKRRPPRRWTVHGSANLFGALVGAALLVATAGNFQMTERFSQTQSDTETREAHWHEAAGWLDSSTEWLIGKGIGRYPSEYFWHGPAPTVPGSFAFVRDADDSKPHLRLSAAAHPFSWGDMLRVSQVVSATDEGPWTVEFDVRARQPVDIHVELCGKHLLYNAGCAYDRAAVRPGADTGWRHVVLPLKEGGSVSQGPWYAPQRAFFAIALGSDRVVADIDHLRLLDASGTDRLRNGDFNAGSDFWFFSSDRDHLPWHAKNVFIHLLLEQGLLGLAAFGLTLLAAAVRLFLLAPRWPLAPYFLASLAGLLTIGMVDSLLDMPRLTTLIYLVLSATLVYRPAARPPPAR